MPMKRYKSAAGRFPTPREPRANMGDLNLLNQAWPNAVFGLRPRLFFLLIPYIHIFILHNRRLYERKRPYHLRASDLRGNGTDPGDDPVHPHALRCLPLQFCRIQGVQNRHCSQRRHALILLNAPTWFKGRRTIRLCSAIACRML